MRHTKAVTRQPAAAQTTLQVKLDFKTGMSGVGIGVAQALLGAGGALSGTLLGAGGSLSGTLFDFSGAGAFQFLTKAAVPGGGAGGDTGGDLGGDVVL